MNETINASIASRAFTMEVDAYATLRRYLDDVAARLPDDNETMNDIEGRIAEILCERVSSPMRVVTLDMVRATISRMGNPDAFGEPHSDSQSCGSTNENNRTAAAQDNRLYRSRTNRSIAGVCGGLAEQTGADVTLLRVIAIVLVLAGTLSIWIYVILWLVVPERPATEKSSNNNRCHERR